jgi:hypothetical protein
MGKTESFLPQENIQIFYDLNFESKRDIYEHIFKEPVKYHDRKQSK